MSRKNVDSIPMSTPGPGKPGPYLAKIVSHIDPTYMGTLEVELLRPVGNASDSPQGQLHQVKFISPFWGNTGIDYVTPDPNDYNNTQKSYGMWFVPPDVGTTVMVFFIDGDPKRGYWYGCVPQESMNFMVPGIAATEFVTDGKGRLPVAEYNKRAASNVVDPTQVKKPKHPIAEVFEKQGLLLDDIRGITTSSARREIPSFVFGVSTPGPTDKRSGAKKGSLGKKEHKVDNAFVSRLGGSTFVMDDGDDKFLRKKPASEAKPEYVAVEQGESGGNVTIPHNELIRIRTRTGHQILLHNSEDLIYIGNAKGTSWIELTSNGKIDIYAQDSVSIHTDTDLNFYAGRDINLEAGRNVNLKANTEMQVESAGAYNLVVGQNGKITVGANLHVNTASNNYFTAGANTEIKSSHHIETASRIDMNGPGAATAEKAKKLKTHTLPSKDGKDGIKSIMKRSPTQEPYPQHENLDPQAYSKSKTDRDSDGRYDGTSNSMKSPAELWKKFTTKIDTFKKMKPPEKRK